MTGLCGSGDAFLEVCDPGFEFGLPGEGLAQLALRRFQRLGARGLRHGRLLAPQLRGRFHVGEPAALHLQPRIRGSRIVERALAVTKVVLELLVRLAQARLICLQPGSLVAHRAPAFAQPRQLGGERRVVLAQTVHLGRGLLARGPRGTQPLGAKLDLRAAIAQKLLRCGQLAAREAPATGQQGCFDLAMRGAELPVAAGLTRLLAQLAVLFGQRGEEILHAQKVGLGGLQLQLGLMATRLQAADPGRLLEQAAPVRWLRVDQATYPTLADDGGTASAGGGIGAQELHVPCPHFPAIDPEDRSGAPADAP